MMANAADGYLGDWLPHKQSCRCTDCSLERAEKRIAALEAENAQLKNEAATSKYMQDLAERNSAEHAEDAVRLEAENARLKALIEEADQPDGSLMWTSDHRKILATASRPSAASSQS